MKPVKVFRIGRMSASMFVNEIERGGGKRQIRNVNLRRRYRDGDEWKSSSSFGLADIPGAQAVLDLALTYVAVKEADLTNWLTAPGGAA